MPHSPFFSIIIPTYNRASFIKKTIESVLQQDFEDYEVIVIDDGSTDDTESAVKTILDERLRYKKKENGERAAARNEGALSASGKYLNFLDSDDCLYPNHLRIAKAFILNHADVELFHLGYDMKDISGNLKQKMSPISDINKQIIRGNVLSCNGVFIRRDIILQNKFNEDRALSSLEDWELWIRMSSRYVFRHENTVTSTVILHDERSVLTGNTVKIKQKTEAFIRYVSEDGNNRKIFSVNIRETYSSAYMYAALHLAMIKGAFTDILAYLYKGIKSDWKSVFTKRFLVILKLLLLNR